jgi:murein DD-endopeptidase MepM/ murein hydrolase activator NlpD
MKKNQHGESKAHRFFSGKGFYASLAVSLVAIGGAAWLGVNSALDQLDRMNTTPNNVSQNEQKTDLTPSDAEAGANQENVPVTPPAEEPVSSAQETDAPVPEGYILPLSGKILNAYSGDKVVKSLTLDEWVMHTGIDLEAPVSTPVKAVSSGKVIEVKNDELWGTTVTIEHSDGVISYYANLKSAVNVKQGQQVKLGDVVGQVGETADIERADASHLHFGMKKDGEWIDPMQFIGE